MEHFQQSKNNLASTLSEIKNIDSTSFPEYKIAVLRNITLESIKPFIELNLLRMGLKPVFYFADFNNIHQEALNPQSEFYNFKPDTTILAIKKEIAYHDLSYKHASLSLEESQSIQDLVISDFTQICQAINQNSSTSILIHNFESPTAPSLGILDYQLENAQLNLIRSINIELARLAKKLDNCFIVDLDLLQSRIGAAHFYDKRYWHIGKAPYSKDAYPSLANEYCKIIRALKGKAKKCLILDLDNTLWGGIIGEDGINKIGIGDSFPGSAFKEFQYAILNLYNRGVILGVCSKNNIEDAMEVFEKHPDMVLRAEHFSIIKANWNDKASNIRSIAKEINIGLDSIVFIDDSDFETELVRNEIPEVTTIKLTKDPTQYAPFLNEIGLFDTLTFSEEDKKRNQMYRAESLRNNLKNEAPDLNNYLKSLNMEVVIEYGNEYSIPRISQLTQRSNQFNLTTLRYSEDDIRSLVQNENSDVLTVQLNDKFGNSGISGVAIISYENESANIESFLMSCRIIGRGAEDVLIDTVIKVIKDKGHKSIFAKYIKSAKNQQVQDFYVKRGFDVHNHEEQSTVYKFNQEANHKLNIDHFKDIHFAKEN